MKSHFDKNCLEIEAESMATAPEEIEQVAKTSKVETPEAARESEPNGVVESIKDDIMEEENQVVSQTKIDGKQIFFLILLALIFFRPGQLSTL